MGTAVTLALAAARRRFRTLAFIGAAMGISTFLAALAFLLFAGNREPAAAMMRKAATPDLFLIGDDRLLPAGEARAWWRGKSDTAEVVSYPINLDFDSACLLNDKPMHNLTLLLTEAVAPDRGCDLLLDPEGGETVTAAPARGEIWLTATVARAYGAKPGDTVTVTTSRGEAALRLSAIIIDPLFNPGMMNPRRAWVAPGFLAEQLTATELSSYALAIAFKSGEHLGQERIDALWREFTDIFGYSGFNFFRWEIEGAYGFLGTILGAVMSFLAAIAFLGGIAILQTTIANTIRADYKLIGVYQTLGLPPARIALIFLLQFAPALLVFAAVGTAAAPLAYRLIAQASLEATGAVAPELNVAGLIGVGGAIALAACSAAAIFSAVKAGSVRTADAIRLGEAAPKAGGKTIAAPLSAVLPLWAAVGLRQARLGLGRAAAVAFTAAFAAIAAYTGFTALGAMSSFSRKPDFFGLAESHVVLQRDAKRFKLEHDRLYAELAADPSVTSVLASGIISVTLPSPDDGALRTIYSQVFDGDLEQAGFHVIEGRHPSAILEAEAAVATARDYGLVPSSELAVRVIGVPFNLKIVGIYQSMTNMGQGFRLTGITARALSSEYEPIQYDIFLTGDETPEVFAQRLETRFGEGVDAELTADRAGAFVASILSGMYGAVAAAGALLMAAAFLAAAGATVSDTRENARSFAIMNLIGLERKTIAMAVTVKAFVIALGAAAIGTAIGVFSAPPILFVIIRGMGLVEIPFFMDIPAAAVIITAMAVWSGFAAWLTAVLTLRADARLLVVE